MTSWNYKYQSDIGMKFLKANLLLLGLLGCHLGAADEVIDETGMISDIFPTDTSDTSLIGDVIPTD